MKFVDFSPATAPDGYTKPDEKEVRATRPASLPEVEPELRGAPPHNIPWLYRDGSPKPDSALAEWGACRAVKGWVVRVEVKPDYEGPDFFMWFACEVDGELHMFYEKEGLDTYHWGASDPEQYDWFHKTMKAGRAITLLLEGPGGKTPCRIYGQLNCFLKVEGGKPRFTAD